MLDALVIGGGFYGVSIACYLARHRGLRAVRLVEREARLMTRASWCNQARIHNGYHYPRSYTTGYRSRVNLSRFLADFDFAARRDFVALYAIARRNSKVSARQFERFCAEIRAPLEPAPERYVRLFDPQRVTEVFVAEEYVFDAGALAGWAETALAGCGVEVSLRERAIAVEVADGALAVSLEGPGGASRVAARNVFNCAYAGLRQVDGARRPARTALKHEIAEMVLLEVPAALRGIGVTLMDGPFFSILPFPPRELHTLSHVRYTPHLAWRDEPGIDPYRRLTEYRGASRAERMLRDACRYLPALAEAVPRGSLLEVKTVLARNEVDDGRPILFERSADTPGLYSVLGGKIDNIYDIIDHLEGEALQPAAA